VCVYVLLFLEADYLPVPKLVSHSDGLSCDCGRNYMQRIVRVLWPNVIHWRVIGVKEQTGGVVDRSWLIMIHK